MILDDARLVGNVDWAQQGRSFDLLRVDYRGDVHVLAFLGVNNVDGNGPYTLANFKYLQGLWGQLPIGDDTKVSVVFLNNGVERGDSVLYSQTVGANVMAEFGSSISVHGTAYLQMGTDPNERDLNGMLIALRPTIALSETNKIRLGFEMISGMDPENAEENTAFTPLYGTNHKFNGAMDYFYVGNHANSVGLIDIYGGFSTVIGNTTLMLDIHSFMSEITPTGKLPDGSEASSSLGIEVDLQAKSTVREGVTLFGGVSMFSPTDELYLIRGISGEAETQLWAYVGVNAVLAHVFD